MTSPVSCSTAVRPVLESRREGEEVQGVTVNECLCLYKMMERSGGGGGFLDGTCHHHTAVRDQYDQRELQRKTILLCVEECVVHAHTHTRHREAVLACS